VNNAATGANLNNARVAVKGTNLVAFTDESGTFQLNGVPSGSVSLRVFFTGLDEQEVHPERACRPDDEKGCRAYK
jgi:hypothetical protein